MKAVKISTTLLLTFCLAIVNMAFANTNSQQHTSSINYTTSFELNIKGGKYSVSTPSSSLFSPVTIKLMEDGNVVYQTLVQKSFMIFDDGANRRVVGDGIDHKVVGDGIDHLVTIEVSQNGMVLFTKQI